jgi:putative FmdB family regulatory protein
MTGSMPTYEYACRSCGRHIDVQQSFTDDPLTTCPTCGGQLRKVFGNIAISFKGTGFYSTDNRSLGKSGPASAKGESDGAATASADGASKSESSSSSSSSSEGSAKSESGSGGSDSKGDSSAPSKSGDKSGGKSGDKKSTPSGDKSPAPAA